MERGGISSCVSDSGEGRSLVYVWSVGFGGVTQGRLQKRAGVAEHLCTVLGICF